MINEQTKLTSKNYKRQTLADPLIRDDGVCLHKYTNRLFQELSATANSQRMFWNYNAKCNVAWF